MTKYSKLPLVATGKYYYLAVSISADFYSWFTKLSLTYIASYFDIFKFSIKSTLSKIIPLELANKFTVKESLSPIQLKIKKLFDDNNGVVSDKEVSSFVKKIGANKEWNDMIFMSYVGRRPGEGVWHWV